ncbi:hypothetical protein [Komagataeibacter melaceti]|uniref:hypothetical protein n=1 Tax=Komagataeibacter melaceti TaxID=2766577 RepID=UPI0011E5B0DE|nr:hypothetical protein [Komagataeibacter melaceti]
MTRYKQFGAALLPAVPYTPFDTTPGRKLAMNGSGCVPAWHRVARGSGHGRKKRFGAGGLSGIAALLLL